MKSLARGGVGLAGLGIAAGLHLAAPPAPRAESADCSPDNVGLLCAYVVQCDVWTIFYVHCWGEYHRYPMDRGSGSSEESEEEPRLE